MNLDPLRQALARKGLTPAAFVPEARARRPEEVSIRLVRLMERDGVDAIALGPASPNPEPLAFLEGIQRSEVVGYAGSAPLVAASIAAAVCERGERRLRTAVCRRRHLVLGRPSALAAAGEALGERDLVTLPEDDPPHPMRDLLDAGRALDRERGALEIFVGDAYRARSDNWIVVDGSLSESPRWANDPRMVAVSKSHSILPFEGQNLERYLRLPVAHRSPIYEPETRTLAPVRAWGLRLWPWEGKDLLYGLVRVEVAPVNGTTEAADRISRWIMAERAPVSAPDRRWDRLLYGIHRVELYLQTSGVG
jgi:hypothetical protein